MDEKWYLLTLKYLGYRPRSVNEIREYLIKKKVPTGQIDTIIQDLFQKNLLNDDAFARMWVQTRNKLNPKSKELLRFELQQKGIDKTIIEEVLSPDKENSSSDFETALLLLHKKKERYLGLSREKLYQKAGGYLMRRGFSYDIIKKCIDELFQQ